MSSGGNPAPTALGPAGWVAKAFIDSKLTPLFILASVLLGLFAVVRLPREEEPQILVPMIDVFVAMPGASPAEVEERVTKPLEKLVHEIPGVEYVYSQSRPSGAMVIVRFLVGEDPERSTTRLNDKLRANRDKIPPGAMPPLIQPHSIDDVPVLALTLWSRRYDGYALRRVAAEVKDAIKQVADVSEVAIIGGERREIRVVLDPDALAARSLAPLAVAGALEALGQRLPASAFTSGNVEYLLAIGAPLASASDVAAVVVGVAAGRPVRVGDVAAVIDGGEEPDSHVRFGHGAAAEDGTAAAGDGPDHAAVTIAVAKRPGKNAVAVVRAVRDKVESLRGGVIPAEVEVAVTRDYGATARDKSNELLLHMLLAVAGVSALIWLALGRREAAIVLLAIPATLALTLTVFYLYGYTLNRITLFALIFSIGILVDDAIVVIENIARHYRLPENHGRPLAAVAVHAVDEVGNPTILATLAVMAAILPMAFVGGLMGPYMRPIPMGASAAMFFSLVVAFVVTPWASIRLLPRAGAHGEGGEESRATRLYRVVMGRLIHDRRWRNGFLLGVVVLLVGSVALVPLRLVKVKMLPFDNKSEFQVVIDLPEGTALEETARVARALAEVVRREPEVKDYQIYAGTSAPYNFNGLVRHSYLRRGANVADIQVNLVGKEERSLQSHPIAVRLRERLQPVARALGASIKVSEVPPGPPVLQTLVAEIYGPDHERRIEVAAQVKQVMERTPGVVNVDWYVEDEQPKFVLEVDREKAALSGVSEAEVARTLRLATSGETAGLLRTGRDQEDVPIRLRLGRAERSDLGRLRSLQVAGGTGGPVAIGELTAPRLVSEDRTRHRKNLLPVVYVTADVAGAVESPVYAMLELGPAIERLELPEGYAIRQYTATPPPTTDRYALKWDGEWQITYEVFRDLGIAFAAVLVLIYVLVVAWFQSFLLPLVIMSAIPFSLVGILPAHGMLHAFFTATSMIGFIAGAGIVVRNSIILVDFIELRLGQGMPLDQAVIDAGAVRFRPMLLTAAAVVVGAAVILFDPIFQGLAIALMAGEIASLLLSRMTVPVVYYLARRRQHAAASYHSSVPPEGGTP